MPSLVQCRSGARIWLFDYGVHRCTALACFTLSDAACTTPSLRQAAAQGLVSYRPLAHVSQIGVDSLLSAGRSRPRGFW